MKESFYYSIFCKASLQSRPPGARNHEKRNLRIQGRMQIFRKMSQKALNRLLALANYSTGPGLLISSGIIDLQNKLFCE